MSSTDSFNYYYGTGDRITEYRKSGYRNQDLSLIKNTRLWRDVNLQLRFEAFNVWNWHNWNGNSTQWGGNAFNTDVNSADFSADGLQLFIRGDLATDTESELFSTDDFTTADQDPSSIIVEDVPTGGAVWGFTIKP